MTQSSIFMLGMLRLPGDYPKMRQPLGMEMTVQPFLAGDFQFALSIENVDLSFGCDIAICLSRAIISMRKGHMVAATIPTLVGLNISVWVEKGGEDYGTLPIEYGFEIYSDGDFVAFFLSNDYAKALAEFLAEAATRTFPSKAEHEFDNETSVPTSEEREQYNENVVPFMKPEPLHSE